MNTQTKAYKEGYDNGKNASTDHDNINPYEFLSVQYFDYAMGYCDGSKELMSSLSQ